MSQIELDEESERLKKEIDEETWRVLTQRDEFRALSKAADVQRNPRNQAGFSLNPHAAPSTRANPLSTAAAPPQTSGVQITDLGPDGILEPQVSEAEVKLDDAWVRDFNP